MRKLAQVGVLCELLGCEPTELTKHNTTVYQWRGIMYEVTGKKSQTAPASHYVTVKCGGKLWSVRELGSQSAIVKRMKGIR